MFEAEWERASNADPLQAPRKMIDLAEKIKKKLTDEIALLDMSCTLTCLRKSA